MKIWYTVYKAKVRIQSLFTTFTSEVKHMCHMYRYVLKHPFRQDGHDGLNMDQQLLYFYTDNFSSYLIVGHLSQRPFIHAPAVYTGLDANSTKTIEHKRSTIISHSGHTIKDRNSFGADVVLDSFNMALRHLRLNT